MEFAVRNVNRGDSVSRPTGFDFGADMNRKENQYAT